MQSADYIGKPLDSTTLAHRSDGTHTRAHGLKPGSRYTSAYLQVAVDVDNLVDGGPDVRLLLLGCPPFLVLELLEYGRDGLN